MSWLPLFHCAVTLIRAVPVPHAHANTNTTKPIKDDAINGDQCMALSEDIDTIDIDLHGLHPELVLASSTTPSISRSFTSLLPHFFGSFGSSPSDMVHPKSCAYRD